MAAMVMAQRTKTGVSNAQSLSLVKNLIRVSVSSICYLRGLFPEDCYAQKDYVSMKVMQLKAVSPADEGGKGEVRSHEAHTLVKWLEQGVFDALGEGYLHSVVMALLTEGEEQVIETYTFRVHYHEDGGISVGDNKQVVASDKEGLKEQAIKMIRRLLLFSETLDPLPSKRVLSFKLLYTADTPASYEPPFFKPADADCLSMAGNGNVLRVKLGEIYSTHHGLELRFSGCESRPNLAPESMSVAGDEATVVDMAQTALPEAEPPCDSQLTLTTEALNELDLHVERKQDASAVRTPRMRASQDSDCDSETVYDPPSPAKPKNLKAKPASPPPPSPAVSKKRSLTMASETLLEQGDGYNISLTQESAAGTRKASVIAEPLRLGMDAPPAKRTRGRGKARPF